MNNIVITSGITLINRSFIFLNVHLISSYLAKSLRYYDLQLNPNPVQKAKKNFQWPETKQNSLPLSSVWSWSPVGWKKCPELEEQHQVPTKMQVHLVLNLIFFREKGELMMRQHSQIWLLYNCITIWTYKAYLNRLKTSVWQGSNEWVRKKNL